MKTVIIKCDCNHSFQDSLYGRNCRVANISGKDPQKAKCTVYKNVVTGSFKEGK